MFAALVPPGVVVTSTLTAPAPAARAGVVQVIVVASITLKLVATVPPKVTPVAPVKFVPKSVTLVPPAMVPVAGAMLVSVGGTAVPARQAEALIAVLLAAANALTLASNNQERDAIRDATIAQVFRILGQTPARATDMFQALRGAFAQGPQAVLALASTSTSTDAPMARGDTARQPRPTEPAQSGTPGMALRVPSPPPNSSPQHLGRGGPLHGTPATGLEGRSRSDGDQSLTALPVGLPRPERVGRALRAVGLPDGAAAVVHPLLGAVPPPVRWRSVGVGSRCRRCGSESGRFGCQCIPEPR